jgi:hypothetical protein
VIIAVDFDGTIVRQEGRAYDDVTTPLEFLPGALEGLQALKRAGHKLILWSGRASPGLLEHPEKDILVRAGIKRVDMNTWARQHEVNVARWHQMCAFLAEHARDIFTAIDDGVGGKPGVDLFIDDKALHFGAEMGWGRIVHTLGERMEKITRQTMERRLYEVVHKNGAMLHKLGDTRQGPIWRVSSLPGSGGPLVVIIAGQHGDEPAGPTAIFHHLDALLERSFALGVSMVVYPVVNPEGLWRGTRRNIKGQRKANTAVEFKVKGEWVPALKAGERPEEVRRVEGIAKETALLLDDLDAMGKGKISAVLDLHQDAALPSGHAFAYVFGDRDPYAAAMRTAGALPWADQKMPTESWIGRPGVKLQTDADGLVELHDGSIIDYLWSARGAKLAACLETATPDATFERAVADSAGWMRAMVELAAGRLW